MNNNTKKINVASDIIFDKFTFLFALLGTILANGEIIFNKIAWHDETMLVYSGWKIPLEHGRWLNFLFIKFLENFAGAESLSVPNGIIVGLCIGAMSCMIFYLFGIYNKYIRAALIFVFISIPVVAANFGYMSWSGMNFIGLLLCVVSLFIIARTLDKSCTGKKMLIGFLAASVIAGCAVGQYQCFVTFYITLLLTYLIKLCIDRDMKGKSFAAIFIYFILAVAAALVFYLIVLKIFLAANHAELSDYAGISSYGKGSVADYLARIQFSYLGFVQPSATEYATMFPFHWNGWHIILLILIAAISIYYFVQILRRKKVGKFIQLLICLAVFPLAINLNFVLYGSGLEKDYHFVHALHMYQMIMLFVLPFLFLCNADMKSQMESDKKKVQYFFKTMLIAMTAFTFIMGGLYVRYDNFCYMESEVRQEKAIAYFTTLRARVESVEGYDPSMTVYFMNQIHKENNVDEVTANYDYPATFPFDFMIINSNYWYEYMDLWTGWRPPMGDESVYVNDPREQVMPAYPADGSIQILDGNVVVKFN